MARNNASGDYFADSESSDLYLPPTRMHRTTHKPTRSRRVTVRSPSEEDLFERTSGAGDGRAPKQHAVVHHSSSDEEEEPKSAKAHEQGKAETEGATAPPGVAPYNAPAGTTVQNGSNPVYIHSYPTQPGCLPGQPFFHTPCTYAINYPGQPTPFIIANPATMEDYQNAAPNNGGLNFQPQVPDTSLGPMIHTYRPSYDGGVVYAQPGIAGPQGVAVPFQGGPTTAPIMPVIAQQPYQQQPMMVAGGVQVGQPVMMAAPGGFGGGGVPPGQPVLVNGGPAPMMGGGVGQPAYMMPGNNTFLPIHNEPATGIGETAGQVASAYMANPELNEPQEFKPADENPSRMYMVRQLDGQYIQMPRITIDSFGKGIRWYATDEGVFYAVRLET
ncbi:hypothetical protein VSDG_05954 [Cytospora chrysosperma]|uniref:Uncharacterized protein n=1 Tax=Cytospora chrysosperma TaxID=252740 RepID=A0A423VTU4_CYTCH|nr:hypothetical protein VSDG_05954 [Valsa sordida]